MNFKQNKQIEKPWLMEYKSFDQAGLKMFEAKNDLTGGKDLCLKGIFIQGDVKNHNQRVYPTREIARAVNDINQRIQSSGPVGGQLEHPEQLTIDLGRVSHLITEMWMDGNDGYGTMKLVNTPVGNIARVLIEAGAKLGVSSRGSGNVDDNGVVSDFDIVTVDIVAQPSAPNAFPRAIYESLYNMKGGHNLYRLAEDAIRDERAKQYLVKDVVSLINELKI